MVYRPLAVAIGDAAAARGLADRRATGVRVVPGRGVRARVGRVRTAVGSAGFAAGETGRADVPLERDGPAVDLARLTADVVVVGPDLRKIPWLLAHARRVRRVVRQNLAWAFAYNAGAVGLAAAGKLTPVVAALAMLASSAFVVANARRLARVSPAG